MLATLLGSVSVAGAQGGPALHWVRAPGAESCIAPAALAQAVEGRFGSPIFASASDAELALEGQVAPQGSGYRVVLQVSDRDGKVLGSRTLESPGADCRALDEAVILVLVLTLDPDAGLIGGGIALPDAVQARLDDALSRLDRAIEDGQVPAAAPPEPTPAPQAPRSERPARVDAPTAPRWALEGFGGLSFGATPALSWVAGVRTGFQAVDWPLLEFSALAIGPSSEPVEDRPAVPPDSGAAATATVSAWGAALAAHVCMPRGPRPRVRLRLCGGLEAGVLRGSAQGFVHDNHQFFPHVALSTAGALELPLGRRWLLGLEVGGLLPLTRPEFVYETSQGGKQSVFLTSPVIGRTLLLLGLRVD